jgi:hypothetical protein
MLERVLAGSNDCRDGNCPIISLTDRGTALVVGSTATEDVARFAAPAGEGAVEIPLELLLRAAAEVSKRDSR